MFFSTFIVFTITMNYYYNIFHGKIAKKSTCARDTMETACVRSENVVAADK